jgi:hypothetical protein
MLRLCPYAPSYGRLGLALDLVAQTDGRFGRSLVIQNPFAFVLLVIKYYKHILIYTVGMLSMAVD